MLIECASNAHNITTRTFHLQIGYNVIEKEFGISVACSFKENAYLALIGKKIYNEEPEMIRHKKLFSLFKSVIKLVMSPYRYQWRHSVMLWVKCITLDACRQKYGVRRG